MGTLLSETTRVLRGNWKTPKDVKRVWCKEFKTTRKNFVDIADIDYDWWYWAAEIATDLLVVWEGFWLERHEYDWSEWWEFKSTPVEPKETKTIKAVRGGMWMTLLEINKE